MLITPVYHYSPSVIHRCIDAIVNSTYCVLYQDILTQHINALCWYIIPVLQSNETNELVLWIKSIVLLLWKSTETKNNTELFQDDVIKWKHFPRYRPFVRGIHRSTVNSPHKGHWRGALVFSLICALHKQSWGRWFETPSLSLWRHRNAKCVYP